MTERKWTPGPWFAVADSCNNYSVINFTTDIVVRDLSWDLNEVNDAHLIAAAPDLYEALEKIVTRYHKGEDIYGWIDVAGLALAKAKGEQ